MKYLIIIIALIVLAGCTTSGVGTHDVDCLETETGGYDCTAAFEPYQVPTPAPTGTPYPPTTGTFTLGESFSQYMDADTDVSWTIVQSPGPAHLIDHNRSVVLAVVMPGDYLLEASWTYSETMYTAPFTLTVNLSSPGL